DWQQTREGARRHAGSGDRDSAARGQVTEPSRRWSRQPWEPLLLDAVLGAGAGQADRRPRASVGVCGARAATGGGGAEDRRRAACRAGVAGGDRRVLPAGPVARGSGDAAVEDVQRGDRELALKHWWGLRL